MPPDPSDGGGPSFPVLPRLHLDRIRARSLLVRSELGERKYGFRYSVNPYRGCPHGCTYCYASSVTRDARPWGRVLDVKENGAEVLAQDLRKARRGLVLLSSATDPYPPQEAREGLTRKCLERLREARFPVAVLTRSPLVLRDQDLLDGWADVDVGFSFTSARDRGTLEPRVPPVKARLRALHRLHERDVRTWASVAPLLPGTPQEDLRELVRALAEAGVAHVYTEPLLLGPYPDAARRMAGTGVPPFAPGEAERLVRTVVEAGETAGVRVHRRFLAWRPESTLPAPRRGGEPSTLERFVPGGPVGEA